jgi:hypothetical protein
MARRPPRIVAARLKKWPPKNEGFSYVRILCGYTYPSGQKCPAQLGITRLVERDKAYDRSDPASYYTRHVIPLVEGGGGIDHLGLGEFAPEFGLVITENTHFHDMQRGDWEGLWIVIHERGYRLVKKPDGTEYFDSLLPHKGGLTGANAARRPMVPAQAAALEDRIDPNGDYGFTADWGTLGDVPTLPATIRCPRCSTPERSTLNEVRPPTNDDLRPTKG